MTHAGGARGARVRPAAPLGCRPGASASLAVLAVLGPGLVSRLRRQRRRRDHHLLAGRRRSSATPCCGSSSPARSSCSSPRRSGARLGLATGKGLIGLIRERFGVRWAAFAAVLDAGRQPGLHRRRVRRDRRRARHLRRPAADQRRRRRGRGRSASSPSAATAGSSTCSSASASLRLGRLRRSRRSWPSPDWAQAVHSLLVPAAARRRRPTGWPSSARSAPRSRPGARRSSSRTSPTSACGPDDLPASRLDVVSGALLTNVIAAFIVIACAATLYANGVTITSAADAAQALEPLAGPAATVLFALGLLGRVVPGPRRRPADERLHDVRGVRLGDRASTGTGARRRPSTGCSPSSSASPPCSS